MGLNKATTLSCHVEFTIFEVPDKGFYMVLSAVQAESYDSLRMLIRVAKMMLMFIE